MPKLLKSEHLNGILYSTEKILQDTKDKCLIVKLGVKVLILIAKLIRDMRHNQVEIMKKMGITMAKAKKVEKVGKDE